MNKLHSFHIPVMGIAYTIDTPLKVAHLGIDSVISLVDDILLEKLRKMYSEKFQIPYSEITDKIDDFRAKRITSYLNLMNDLVDKKFQEFKKSLLEKGNNLKEFMNLLPDDLSIKQKGINLSFEDVKTWISEKLTRGSIDVNIMTKVDKNNYRKNEQLPVEYNDAHAALRGFAKSNLHSSVILSAGMNPHLYSYIEQFDDFYPTTSGDIKKKIALKVSDYRSALIQGKFFAKKGLWVSEYRVESGLNCGGHAFATEGHLMGPILAEFRDNRQTLISSVFELLKNGLSAKRRDIPAKELALKITAQGGVGNHEEHEFLQTYYNIDSVGWGSPFLLVPEATTVDETTLKLLEDAKEDDLYLSNISPLGVPFNSLRGNTKDIEKLQLAQQGKPGSVCPKKYVTLDSEFSDKGMCTASRQYQRKKLSQLKEEQLATEEYESAYRKIIEKSCICVGLGTPALLVNHMDTKTEGTGVSVCPGPNIAYFPKEMSLKEMIDHIYGKNNVVTADDRPNMFIKELHIYIDYLKNKVDEAKSEMNRKQEKYLKSFSKNLTEGIEYYQDVFSNVKEKFSNTKQNVLSDLNQYKTKLQALAAEIEKNVKS